MPGLEKLFQTISNAKDERIDKQYYVETKNDSLTNKIAKNLFSDAENFVQEIKIILLGLGNSSQEELREKLLDLI